MFARSIRENIAYGLPGATDEQIIAVSKASNAHDFISKFPQGYDTEVGDKGAQLSGGKCPFLIFYTVSGKPCLNIIV